MAPQKRTITLHIRRCNPEEQTTPRFQRYTLESTAPMSLLSALRCIFEDLDASLAWRDYECHMGTCRSCLMQLDGKTVQACSTMLQPGDEVHISPVKNGRLIRDLVVDFSEASASGGRQPRKNRRGQGGEK